MNAAFLFDLWFLNCFFFANKLARPCHKIVALNKFLKELSFLIKITKIIPLLFKFIEYLQMKLLTYLKIKSHKISKFISQN